MRPTHHVLALLLLAGSALATDPAPARAATRGTGDRRPMMRCASPEPSRAFAERCRYAVRDIARITPLPTTARIRVVAHVVSCGRVGAVSDERILAQIDELNRAYAETGFQFTLDGVERTDDCSLNKMLPGSNEELEAKERLSEDPEHRLNLYIAAPATVLGWAYFPQTYAEHDAMNGVVIHHETLPGGPEPYGRGRTAVHEVGHYLGLFHTFQNGCTGDGDGVEDTPAEAKPALGCPDGRNTCESPGDDPIHNYMNYSNDVCMNEFTPGQIERMVAVSSQYRRGLFQDQLRPLARARSNARPHDRFDSSIVPESEYQARLGPIDERRATAGERIGMTRTELFGELRFDGAIPNPACHVNHMRFALPRASDVRLVLRDEDGHVVRSIVNGRYEAGQHEVPWDPDGLRAGLYSAELRVRGVVHIRTVVIEREI